MSIVLSARQQRYCFTRVREQMVACAYYQLNKECINTKHRCSCGGVFTVNNHSNHKKTKRHMDFATQTGIFQYPLYTR